MFSVLTKKTSGSIHDPLPVYNGVHQGTHLTPNLSLTMIDNLSVDFSDGWTFIDDWTFSKTGLENLISSPMDILEQI